MGKVGTGFSMSLDGFIAEPDDSVERLFRWYSLGGADHEIPIGDHTLKMNAEGAEFVMEAARAVGALVTDAGSSSRRMAGAADTPWMSRSSSCRIAPRQTWVEPGWPITFVHDGVPSAIAQAKALAGDKTVAVSSASITQQCLNAGLLDEIHIDLVPILLSHGIRLFDHLTTGPLDLECTE